MAKKPRFLVVDGYAKQGREDLRAGGATPAGELYVRMLQACCPGAEADIVCPADPGSTLPQGAGLDQYDGIAWTGSSLTIHKADDKVVPQIEFARAAFAAGVPSFGSCWAAQIAVVAAGGRCAENPRGREMFLARKIALTDAGRAHPLYRDKKSVFDAWISHDDEVTHLPAGAQVLATNEFTAVQSVTVTYQGGTFWALQYHPEYDIHEMARLMYCRKQKLVDKGFFADVDQAQAMVDDLEALYQDPSRRDLAWRYGLDEDVLNPDIRRAEVKNWIQLQVLPRMGR